jgi:hypothetical protein
VTKHGAAADDGRRVTGAAGLRQERSLAPGSGLIGAFSTALESSARAFARASTAAFSRSRATAMLLMWAWPKIARRTSKLLQRSTIINRESWRWTLVAQVRPSELMAAGP